MSNMFVSVWLLSLLMRVRFEVAKELEEELNSNDRLTMKMQYALTGLPSVTYTGMNVMLPHDALTWGCQSWQG